MKIEGLSPALSQTLLKSEKSGEASGSFADMLENFIADVNSDLKAAAEAQQKLVKGEVDNMIEIMTTIEKADISLRLATEIRNKALEAYQDIMRMQV